MSLSRIALISLWLTTIAACGQSGPLYLPGNPSDVQEAPMAEPLPDNGDEDDEDDAAP